MEEREQNTAEVIQVRRDKLNKLVEEGRNPYEVVRYDKDAYAEGIKENYADYEGKEVSLAGRMVSKRIMGKASFAHLLECSGSIQLYVRRDDLGVESYAAFKKTDIGDIIGVKGIVFTTRMGEISVHCKSVELLSKSLLPLPEKYHGLKDTDL